MILIDPARKTKEELKPEILRSSESRFQQQQQQPATSTKLQSDKHSVCVNNLNMLSFWEKKPPKTKTELTINFIQMNQGDGVNCVQNTVTPVLNPHASNQHIAKAQIVNVLL